MSSRRMSRVLNALVISGIVALLAVPAVFALAADGVAVSGKRVAKKGGKVVTVATKGGSAKRIVGEVEVSTSHELRPDLLPTPPDERPLPSPEPPPTPDDPSTEGCSGVKVAAGASIQSAINGNPAGTTLCLSAGSYNTSSTIKLKDGINLIGAGREATFIKTSSAPTVLDAKGTEGVLFKSFDVGGAVGTAGCKPACGRGIATGLNTVVDDVRSHDNANTGIGGTNGNLLVINSELDNNGSSAFLGCCASGIKTGLAFAIRDSYVHDNVGVGVWCDVGCDNGTFEASGNTVTNNYMGGIRYEISAVPAVISGNTVKNNNLSNKGGHGGIEINSSKNAVVSGNILGGNKGAGIIANGGRAPGLGNVKIQNNVLNGDRVGGCGGSIVCTANK